MIRHNLLILYRNFRRFKSTFIINLVGLSSGLACTLLIYLWIADEWNKDKFHQLDSRLYQVFERQVHSGSIRVTNSTPWLLSEALKEEVPDIEFAAVVTPSWYAPFTLSHGETHTRASGRYAGEDFFYMFSWELIAGNKDQLLSDKKSIVITRDVAMRLFDTVDGLVGRTIEWQHEREFIISGVIENIPSSSSQGFDFVLSIDVLKETMNEHSFSWGNSGPFTYIVLGQGISPESVQKKIENIIKTKTSDTHRTLMLTPYSDTYLFNNYSNGVLSGGRIDYVMQFSLLAFFILVVACINFMNLSTAKAARRLKEVGIKKALGAGRRSLVGQHLFESLLMSLISLLIALLVVDLLMPAFNQLTGKNLALRPDMELLVAAVVITLFTGILSGSYPALYLSGFRPASVLKGKLVTSGSEAWARKGLVIFQFAISVLLIVTVVVIYRQIQFIQAHQLGYDKDNVVYFEMEGPIKEKRDVFINQMKNIPGVVNASSIGQSIIGDGNTTNIGWEGKDPETIIPFFVRPVNYDALELFDLQIVTGRSFSREYADTLQVIFNETGIRTMGMNDPIGKTVQIGPFECKIVGVVEDFHFDSFHTQVGPLLFFLTPHYTEKFVAKIEAGKTPETLEKIEALYRQQNPGFTFSYRFVDQDFQAQYANEIRVGRLSWYFAVLAILISCLGLFGLAAFTAERRIKEIGIRKVLGASEAGIVYLLSGDFTKMVLAAIVLAVPVSYFIASQWLDRFAFRIPLTWWYFAGPAMAAMLIAWLTVGLQTWKAARVNPAQCLKDD